MSRKNLPTVIGISITSVLTAVVGIIVDDVPNKGYGHWVHLGWVGFAISIVTSLFYDYFRWWKPQR